MSSRVAQMVVLSSSQRSSYLVPSPMQRCRFQPQLACRAPTSRFVTDLGSDQRFCSLQRPDPAPTSASSSPPIHGEPMDMSCSSTPARDVSMPSDYDEGIHLFEPSAEHARLSRISGNGFSVALNNGLGTRPDLKIGASSRVSSVGPGNFADASKGRSPELREFNEHCEDDTAINVQPRQNVDYLSHDWKEEEIWSSWKYITFYREEHPNSARLENAIWRTWAKYKNNLGTVSPKTLNWLKEGDVTWLYGPVQPGAGKIHRTQSGLSSASLHHPKSPVKIDRKPILKRRSISDTILQRPSSTSLLAQHATPAAQAREKDSQRLKKLSFDRTAIRDDTTIPMPLTSMSCDTSGMLPSSTTTGKSSLGAERKRIHFNAKVEQCIAVEINGSGDDHGGGINIDTNPIGESNPAGGIMMKLERPRKSAFLMEKKVKEGKNQSPCGGKSIAMLPPTTLKHRGHVSLVPEATIHDISADSHSDVVSPLSPQEAARAPIALGRFSEDTVDADTDSARRSSGGFEEGGLHCTTCTDSWTGEPAGMRFTQSSMIMPDEEAVTPPNEGIFWRTMDVFDTLRDIIYLTWNTGWR